MVLLSSSSPSRRQGAVRTRRNTPVLTILLLVLSHNVWNTLQCVTSSSQPKNRPAVNMPPEDDDSSGGFENGPVSNNDYVEGGGRSGGGQVVGNVGNRDLEKKDGESIQQKCSYQLLDAMNRLCGSNNFYVPGTRNSLNEILGIVSKRSTGEMIQRRLTRSLALANECCKKPCSNETMRKFCWDRNRIPKETTREPAAVQQVIEMEQEEDTEEEEETQDVQQQQQQHQQQIQLAPSSPEEPEPAIYYPLFHFIKFMHRQFGNKNADLRPAMMMDGEGDTTFQGGDNQRSTSLTDERELPLPLPRVQHVHSHSRTSYPQQQRQPQQEQLAVVQSNSFQNYRPKEYQRYEGNPYLLPTDMSGNNVGGGNGVSFTNNVVASHHHQGHHNRPMATNTGRGGGGGGTSASTNELANRLLGPMKNYLRHHQQGQQPPRKSSTNVLTSTIAPGVTMIRLDSLTDDEAPFVKRK